MKDMKRCNKAQLCNTRLTSNRCAAWISRAVWVGMLTMCVNGYANPNPNIKITNSPERGQYQILLIGDSLCAAYGLSDPKLGWVHLVEQKIPKTRIINACVSGQTSAGARGQVDRLLKEHPVQQVWIAIGSNDGLRGAPVSVLKSNLQYMVEQSKRTGAQVSLFQMHMPPNYGSKYSHAFSEVYKSVAQEYQIGLIPYLLEPIALDRQYFLPDQMHPNAQGQEKIRDYLLPTLQKISALKDQAKK